MSRTPILDSVFGHVEVDDSSWLKDVVADRLKFIAQHRESLVSAWVAETGYLPSESVLCIQNLPNSVRVWVEKKGEADES